jgi:hypothetical protein
LPLRQLSRTRSFFPDKLLGDLYDFLGVAPDFWFAIGAGRKV